MTSEPGWQRPGDSAPRPATARLVDTEDDVAASYGGPAYGNSAYEAETTRIPHYSVPPEPTPPPSTAYGLVGEPEPLPYTPPPAEASTPMPAPREIVAAGEEAKAAGRRGTLDLGLLLLRLALGVVFIAHGLQKAFGWWGGEGLDGFKDNLAEAGYQNAGVLSYVGAGVQIAAGVLLVLGLFTPLAGAAALAFGVNSVLLAVDDQRREGAMTVFGSQGVEYLGMLAVLAAVVILAGPGRYGFDGGRGWARRPFVGSLLALVVGIAGGIAAWLFLHGTNPFA